MVFLFKSITKTIAIQMEDAESLKTSDNKAKKSQEQEPEPTDESLTSNQKRNIDTPQVPVVDSKSQHLIIDHNISALKDEIEHADSPQKRTQLEELEKMKIQIESKTKPLIKPVDTSDTSPSSSNGPLQTTTNTQATPILTSSKISAPLPPIIPTRLWFSQIVGVDESAWGRSVPKSIEIDPLDRSNVVLYFLILCWGDIFFFIDFF